MEGPLNTLIYKRTHTDDPDKKSGTFGICNCMKAGVRSWPFEAVIGVGGKHPDRGCEDIARKITWVGIGAVRSKGPSDRDPLVRFEYFLLLNERGPDFEKYAHSLYEDMFVNKNVRKVLSQSRTNNMQEEVRKILAWAKNHTDTKQSSKSVLQKWSLNIAPRPICGNIHPVKCGLE
jgi:hypothetical protein